MLSNLCTQTDLLKVQRKVSSSLLKYCNKVQFFFEVFVLYLIISILLFFLHYIFSENFIVVSQIEFTYKTYNQQTMYDVKS